MVKSVVLLASTCWWSWVPVLAHALGNAGCDVSAIYPDRGHPLDAVAALKNRLTYRHADALQALRDAIHTVCPDIIVPCDDRAILHLQQLHTMESHDMRGGLVGHDELIRVIERSLGDPAGFMTARSRYPLISLAQTMGIATPETAELGTSRDVDRWLSRYGLPSVFKVDGSWGGDGVIVVRSKAEAHDAFAKLSRPCPFWFALDRYVVNRDPYWLPEWRRRTIRTVSAQTYIDGEPANCAVFCWEGQMLAGIAVEVLHTRYRYGASTIVKVVDRQDMLDSARLLAARLKLSGFFGLDFMIDGSSNAAKLIEMNARPTPLCHLRLGPGRDLVGALAATLSGRPLSAQRVTESDVIVYFPYVALENAAEIPPGAYHDVPNEAPALVKELLLRPWPSRGLLARALLFGSRCVRSGGALAGGLLGDRESRSPSEGGRRASGW